mmetsp:Transcript_108960/g.339565  ORF Transcript_108960/g.339565 Transcript_108960/m.339565 type:complete len:254 (-) Transcript_108960:12-773(-)
MCLSTCSAASTPTSVAGNCGSWPCPRSAVSQAAALARASSTALSRSARSGRPSATGGGVGGRSPPAPCGRAGCGCWGRPPSFCLDRPGSARQPAPRPRRARSGRLTSRRPPRGASGPASAALASSSPSGRSLVSLGPPFPLRTLRGCASPGPHPGRASSLSWGGPAPARRRCPSWLCACCPMGGGRSGDWRASSLKCHRRTSWSPGCGASWRGCAEGGSEALPQSDSKYCWSSAHVLGQLRTAGHSETERLTR